MMRKLSKGRKSKFNFSKNLAFSAMATSMLVISSPAYAVQSGSVNGRITSVDGSSVSGVTVVATSSVLPGKRTTTSAENGRYQLPLLPPGQYTLTYTFSDGTIETRNLAVLLQQKSIMNVTFGETLEEIVVMGSAISADLGRASLTSSLDNATITSVPTGQDYRELQKLIPGVQYSEDSVRGPSAGGSGQDNTYQFDGVDISLPMFGTLSAEPSTHDIAEVSIVRGGATAIGFNRSGGFSMNTISKRGTNEFHGEVSIQMQTASMTAERQTRDGTALQFEEDKTWITASVGGPIIQDKLFFYTSFYRPTESRDNSSNAYGEVANYESKRNEFFGKLTFAPTDNILLDGSFRTSKRTNKNESVGSFDTASTSTGSSASQDIAIIEGSWITGDDSAISFKFTKFKLETASQPDTMLDANVGLTGSLDVNNLASQGFFKVPTLSGDAAYDVYAQTLIDTYGYDEGGVKNGGGYVGGGSTINNQDFTRTSFEIAYDYTLYFGETTHDLHFGYQYQQIEEDLSRLSNGWGLITLIGNRDGSPNFYEARINQMSLEGDAVTNINSMSRLQTFELNDTIKTGDFTINVGLLMSQDQLYGQGLREKDGTISGYEQAPGNRYKMYTVKFGDMLQPRLGVNWDYSETSSIYANFARYNPAASSLARAASWDRNLRKTIKVYFDEAGAVIGHDSVGSSAGKFFDDDLSPRYVDEFLVGWKSYATDNLLLRAHVRHRKGRNFWEDTGNNHRAAYGSDVEGLPQEVYIENISASYVELGYYGSYVIAQLDNAYTNYWEVSLESEYRAENYYINASYVWSRYTGNFDQDNTTTNNDQNTFIGSSNIADGAGRQLWDNKDGILRGDRTHQFKVYGYYKFDWDGQMGAFFIFQSGQPWEAWDSEVYRDLTSSTSDTIRYAEAAGSRRSDSHVQLDLNYTQNIAVFHGFNVQLRADLYNVFNNQTGYNIRSKVNSAGFGEADSYFKPRRLQLALKLQF